jgi:hypothetical protein
MSLANWVLSWLILLKAALLSLSHGGAGSKIHSFLNTRAGATCGLVIAFFFVAILASLESYEFEAMRISIGHTTYPIGRLLELLGEVRRLIYTYR